MKNKPSIHGTTTVDIHTRPDATVDLPHLIPDRPIRVDFDLTPTPRPHLLPELDRIAIANDPDAVLPAPQVTISELPSGTALTPHTSAPSLERYRVPAIAALPAADAQGVRTLKGRQFVDLSDGDTVHISRDPQTGLYRAKLQSEQVASGPLLTRDPDSGFWQPRSDLESIIFPLSDTRLEAFRTALDFSEVEPDSQGLFRHDEKLYVTIRERAYQVLHDRDASSPQVPVMRIVRSDDPVAADADNTYVATRPGRSEPIAMDPQDGWVGVNVEGQGGMRRGERPRSIRQSLVDRFAAFVHRPNRPEPRVQKLYPGFDDTQIARYLQSLGDDVSGALTRKEAEYKTLEKDLQDWTQTHAQIPAVSKTQTKLIAHDIKRCWRRQTEQKLKLPAENVKLPALTADFSHVRSLELDLAAWSTGAETFLNGFTGLETLVISRSALKELPPAIGKMPNLKVLDLRANGLRLDATSAGTLSALNRLESLVLAKNPLGTLPDCASMPGLRKLDLSETGIAEWPQWLDKLTQLDLVDLRSNQIKEVPSAYLNPADARLEAIAGINRHILLEHNPFPEGYWKHFERFWQRVERNHPDLAATVNHDLFRLEKNLPDVFRARTLHTDMDVTAAKKYLLEMDDAGTQLANRQRALEKLEADLHSFLMAKEALPRGERELAVNAAKAIRRCWLDKRESTLTLGFQNRWSTRAQTSVLPLLSADFSHVRELHLDSVEWTADADAFLSGFANLETLKINNSTLERLPPKVSEMSRLKTLDLQENKLQLDQQSATTLGALKHLTRIDLAKNPLKVLPDFSAMAGLDYLDLSHTGISDWPKGLQENTPWLYLNLSHNHLKAVPEACLNPAPEKLESMARRNGATLLERNNFPADYWKVFDAYWRRLTLNHPELVMPGKSAGFDSENAPAQRYRRLYPHKSIEECRNIMWGMEPDTALAKLITLEQEFSLLKGQLDNWVFTGGGGTRQNYTHATQIQLRHGFREDRAEARNRILACWRQETAQMRASDGTTIGLELDLSNLTLETLPDIRVDFSHVGSLKLKKMKLQTSPEGFLTHFRHVRWLDLSDNKLRELPPAIGEMHALTRLFLQSNEISLTADSARILSERTTLRALFLSRNIRLGNIPDFSQMADLRMLSLAHNNIDTFPSGLLEQPSLGYVDLSHNRITELPDDVIAPSDRRLAHSARLCDVTDITNNPLSDATLARVTQFSNRLTERAITLLGPNNLVLTSTRRETSAVVRVPIGDPMSRWAVGLSAEQITARKAQWQLLRSEAGSDGFFNTLGLLLQDPGSRADLQRRVWKVIDSITENSPQSESLRRELFDRAGAAACCDRAAFTFANLETRTMIYFAHAQATGLTQGAQLTELSRGLFRLHEVDKIASADIARREAKARAERGDRGAGDHEHLVHEEVEIRLAYRHGLKDRLQLPGQPKRAAFTQLVNVSKADLDGAYATVKAMDNSPEEFQALVSREFWQEFITHKHRAQFETQRQPFQDKQAALDDAYAEQKLSQADYEAQSKSLQASLVIEEATLTETLTRQELVEQTTSAAKGK